MAEVEDSTFPRRYLRFAYAAGIVAAALLLRQAIVHAIGAELPPFITFYPAVMVAALLCGLGPGLLATALSVLAADYWILPPRGSLLIANSAEVVTLAVFAAMGVFVSVAAEAYRRNQQRISALKREATLHDAQQELRRSKEQFETLANAIPQLCWMANADGWIFWYNQRWYDYTGTTPEQMDGWGWQSVHDPEALPKVMARWQGSVATGEPFDMVFPLKGADGVLRPFLTRVMPVKDADGKVVRWFGTNTDISEQKRAEIELRKSKERLDLAVEVAGLGEWELNLKDGTSAQSPRHQQIFGYSSPSSDWSYAKFLDHVLPELRDAVDRQISSGNSWSLETKIRRADGEVRWIWVRGRRRVNDAGQVVRMFGVITDITERKQAEEALRQQADMLRLSFDAIIVWRLDDGIESWNRGAELLYGYSEGEALGRVTHELLKTTHCAPWPEIEAAFRTRGIWEGELRHVTRDGREVTVSARHQLIAGADGVERILETNRDITERKQAEEALRSSEAKLNGVISSAMDAIISVDDTQRIVVFNRAAEKIFQCPASEALGSSVNRFIPERLRAAHGEHIRRFGEQGVTNRSMNSPGILAGVRSNGEVFPIEATISQVQAAGQTLYTVILRDITERKQAEETLQANEHRWATTLRSIGDAVISTDPDGKIDFMNEVAEKLTGWTLADAKGRDLPAVFDIVQEVTRIRPENPVAKVIRLGKVVGLANHTVLIHRDGNDIPIEDSAAPIRDDEGKMEGVVLVFHDVLEQRKVEAVLRSSERLATMGRLAATIAHEIHNPLDAVGNLLFLIGEEAADDSTREYASMASSELARVTQMTQQMLGFQREASKPMPVKIGEILSSVVALYNRQIQTAGIRLEQRIDPEARVVALPGELRQVFANLVGNAIEAVGPQRGTIVLRAYPSLHRRRGVPGVCVVVADNGPGIPEQVRGKIFEPFFTTKGESGTGLGLSITADILRKYDAAMRLRTCTRPGRSGTCFSVFFPVEINSESPPSS